MRLEPAVGEHDDRVVRAEREELVGERRAGVHERAARLPDPLRDELSVRGEVRRRSDAAPDDPVAPGEDRDRVLERLGRDVASRGSRARRGGCGSRRRRARRPAPVRACGAAVRRAAVVAVRGERPAQLGEAAVSERLRGAHDRRVARAELLGQRGRGEQRRFGPEVEQLLGDPSLGRGERRRHAPRPARRTCP